MRQMLFGLSILLSLVGCNSRSTPETLVTTGYDEAEMEAAIKKAKSEVNRFLSELARPTGTMLSVKAPIEDNGETEHFWLTDVVYRSGEFEGVIGNEPGVVGNVKMGQKWKLKKEEISDWMYMRDERMYGNYTMRPLLKTLPPEEADQMRSMLAE